MSDTNTKVKVKKTKKRDNQNLLGYMFLFPWLLGFLTFTAIPFGYTIYLSFNSVSLTVSGWQIAFLGLDNYQIAFFNNTQFMPAIISFVIMEVTYAPTIVIISFILALLMNRKMKFRAGFRTLFFLPVIVLSGPVMYQLMDSGSTSMMGIEEVFLFQIVANFSYPVAEAIYYLFQNFSMVLWFTGIPIVLLISGLQKINVSILEAAKIDSATSWQILWKITVPIIRPTLMICTIFTIVQLGLYSVNPVFTLIQESIYNTVNGLGLASAYAWIYGFVILGLIGVAFIFLKDPKEVLVKETKRLEKRWNQR